MAAKKKSKKVEVDFSDEESVKLAMAAELDCDPDDLTIEEDSGMSSFREGTIYRVELGQKEYYVAENDEIAHNLAVAIVKQDLEEEPGNFNSSFIESHIDKKALREALQSDVEESIRESLKEDADRNPIKFLEDNDIDIPEPSVEKLSEYCETMTDSKADAEKMYDDISKQDAADQWAEMGESPEIPDDEFEKVVESTAAEQLKDPMAYLEDIYGEDTVKKAIEIAGIDINEAAEEAVSADGEGHFLSSYDGNVSDGPGGLVYWRHN